MQNLKPKAGGKIFNMDRPAFKSGVNNCNCGPQEPIDLKKLNKRNGLGNYNIERPAYEAPKIRARIAGDFDKLQAIDIETQGAKIQLSEKTIAELFKTKIGDKTDTKWLAEKARLTALYQTRGMTPQEIEREFEVNKPLGREQRKITTTQNIAQSSLTVADKIDEIKQEVVDGRGESRAQQAVLTGQLALIFADTQAITQFTQQQLNGLTQTVARLNVPKDRVQLGIIPRIIDIDYYNANRGIINLYIFSNITSDPNYNNGINYDLVVYNFAGGSLTGLPGVNFTSMVSALDRNTLSANGTPQRRYLDLDTRGLIGFRQLRAFIANIPNGFANPAISISVANQYPLIP
jgi:hypothetical protein